MRTAASPLTGARLTVTADDQAKTYGETFTFAGSEFTTDGNEANSDSVASVSLASDGAAATASVAGSPYDITASAATGTGLANYDISYVDGSLTVNLRPLTVTADDQAKTYGDAFSFTGTEFTTDGNLANSDSVDSVSLASDGAAATASVAGGPYAITASAATGTGLANYDISYADGSFTVDLRPLTVTADDQAKTYGDPFSFAGTEFTTDGSEANSDSVDSVTLASDGAAATATVAGGPYAITASAATGTGLANYDISYADGSLTVDLRPLTVTADDQSKTYGDAFTVRGVGVHDRRQRGQLGQRRRASPGE